MMKGSPMSFLRLRAVLRTAVAAMAALLVSAAGAPLSGQAIQLRTGEVLVGEVVDATSEGLSFRRLDTGGFLELGWNDLSTLHAARIKRLKGLVVADDDEPTLVADVVLYLVGGVARDEVVGLIQEYTKTHVMLKRKGDVLPIKREAILRTRKREVPVLEVYTGEEYYQLKLAEAEPGEDADKHIALGEEMRRVGDFARAEEHLTKADELGGGRQASQLPIMLQRVRTLREAEAERELLAQIRIMRNRKEFSRAEELMAEFRQTYPDSRLMAELDREESRFDEALAEHAVERLRQAWDQTVRRVADEKVRDDSVTLASARAYAEDKMSDDVFGRIARSLELEPDAVEKYWSERESHGRGRAIVYTYGVGSWVLGADKIVAGTKAEGGGAGPSGGGGDQDPELDRIIRKLRDLQNQRRRAGGAGGAPREESEEDWWRKASRNDRAGWLRAYFAEFGGHMEITAAYSNPCPNCEASGTISVLGDSGREQKVKCPVCHGTKFTRLFRAR